jgi:ATP-dependent DNA helicase RecG
MPRNPLIAEPLYRISYVEKAGTGTTDMIADCRKAELPEPDFEQRGPYFVVTVWRDRFTEDFIASLGLNDRQKTAILFIKQNGRITNKQYQEISKVTDRTVLRDIQELINKDVLHKIGTTGRATYYIIKKKLDINPTRHHSSQNPT